MRGQTRPGSCRVAPRVLLAVLAGLVITRAANARQWTDISPHAVSLVTVQQGVALEVLDWGGRGVPLVFLAGLGSTAHVFDDFAPRFTDRYRVIAITRRGYHGSSRPDAGYDYPTMARDIKVVCDVLGFDRVVLVGHSMPGGEITRFASLYPERLRAAVYLDAAYDHTQQGPSTDQLPKDPATPDDMRSLDQYIKHLARITGAIFPEADVRATVVMDADGRVLRRETPPAVWKAMEAADEPQAWDYVRVPALAIYSSTDVRSMFPNYDKVGPNSRKQIDAFVPAGRKYKDETADRFRREVAHATVIPFHESSGDRAHVGIEWGKAEPCRDGRAHFSVHQIRRTRVETVAAGRKAEAKRLLRM